MIVAIHLYIHLLFHLFIFVNNYSCAFRNMHLHMPTFDVDLLAAAHTSCPLLCLVFCKHGRSMKAIEMLTE